MKGLQNWYRWLAIGLVGSALSACGGGSSGTGGTTAAPAPTSYTIGGTVTGLTGSGLILQNNAGNNLGVSAGGAFTFTTAVNSGAAYAVTVSTQPTGQTCTVASGSGTASANVTNVAVTCVVNTVTIGGSVSGLTGTVVLQNNGGNNLSVAANGTFTFTTAINGGASYTVTVLTQPAGQTCAVASGSGTASANVTGVAVTCTTTGGGGGGSTVTIGGSLSGLTGTVVLQNNGGNNLSVAANGAFTFTTAVSSGATYAVSVLTQPSGQTCVVGAGSGTASANVTSVAVTCSTNSVNATIGGSLSGLTSAGLVLQLNGANDLTLAANATTYVFATTVATGGTYAVTVKTNPPSPKQTCVVSNGSGTVASGNIGNISIACTTDTFAIGGTISGLTGTGLVLQNNLGDNLTVAAAASSFGFATRLGNLSVYSVSIQTQPAGQTCTLLQGLGIVPVSNVTNVAVSCIANTTDPINGTYTASVSGTTPRLFLTFFSDGTYITADHKDDVSCDNGSSTGTHGDGVEYGVYKYTQSAGTLAIVNAVVDTDGGCGLTDQNGAHASISGIVKSGTTYSGNLTPAGGGSAIAVVLTPVPSPSGSILGSWGGNKLGFTVFSGNNTVVSANTQQLQNVPATILKPGIEDGCYAISGTTAQGTFTVNLANTCSVNGVLSAVDTNGTSGFSGLGGGAVTFTVTADSLQTQSGSNPAVTQSRIIAQ